MVSLNNSLVFKLAILVAIIAFVCCTNDRTHQVSPASERRFLAVRIEQFCLLNEIFLSNWRSIKRKSTGESSWNVKAIPSLVTESDRSQLKIRSSKARPPRTRSRARPTPSCKSTSTRSSWRSWLETASSASIRPATSCSISCSWTPIRRRKTALVALRKPNRYSYRKTLEFSLSLY